MGKNKKAFVPPLKVKHRNKLFTNASLMDNMDKQGSEDCLLVGNYPNLAKATAPVSSSLIRNVVSNSDDAGPTTGHAEIVEPALGEHDGFFLRDESEKAPDVYEFHSSPQTTKHGRNKRSLQHCFKQEEKQSGKRSVKKKKDSSVRQSVLKDIERMQKAMVLLREREQALMTTSEQ